MRPLAVLALTVAVAALAAGCGGGGSGDAEAKAEIERNWETFFDGTTPTAKRIALLEDGARFASLIRLIEGSPLARQLSAKVGKVDVTDPGSAKVKYTVYLGRNPVLKNADGTAVHQGDVWKVGDASFCALVALQGATPQVCKASSR